MSKYLARMENALPVLLISVPMFENQTNNLRITLKNGVCILLCSNDFISICTENIIET